MANINFAYEDIEDMEESFKCRCNCDCDPTPDDDVETKDPPFFEA